MGVLVWWVIKFTEYDLGQVVFIGFAKRRPEILILGLCETSLLPLGTGGVQGMGKDPALM